MALTSWCLRQKGASMKFLCVIGVLVLLPAAASADRQAADTCAAKLRKDAAAIYSASVAQFSTGANVGDIVRSVTRGMVRSGNLTRSDARPAAESAGACLKLLKE
jgi:hypothetical protein